MFGREVRRLRKLANLTLEELAARCGVTPNYIGSIENGHRDPSLATIEAIASGLGVAVGELFGEAAKLGPAALEVAQLFDLASPGFQSGLLSLLHTTVSKRRPRAM
jgi:transcriptional regulator with XRE-family HTH domain